VPTAEFGECPLLALNGHHTRCPECPLSVVKRTSRFGAAMSANDPKRTSTMRPLNKKQRAALSDRPLCRQYALDAQVIGSGCGCSSFRGSLRPASFAEISSSTVFERSSHGCDEKTIPAFLNLIACQENPDKECDSLLSVFPQVISRMSAIGCRLLRTGLPKVRGCGRIRVPNIRSTT
jgi:hypothetical protein